MVFRPEHCEDCQSVDNESTKQRCRRAAHRHRYARPLSQPGARVHCRPRHSAWGGARISRCAEQPKNGGGAEQATCAAANPLSGGARAEERRGWVGEEGGATAHESVLRAPCHCRAGHGAPNGSMASMVPADNDPQTLGAPWPMNCASARV